MAREFRVPVLSGTFRILVQDDKAEAIDAERWVRRVLEYPDDYVMGEDIELGEPELIRVER